MGEFRVCRTVFRVIGIVYGGFFSGFWVEMFSKVSLCEIC